MTSQNNLDMNLNLNIDYAFLQDEEDDNEDLGIYGDIFDYQTPRNIKKKTTRIMKADVIPGVVVKEVTVAPKIEPKFTEKSSQNKISENNILSTKDVTKEFESKMSLESDEIIFKKKSYINKTKVETQTSISSSEKNFVDERFRSSESNLAHHLRNPLSSREANEDTEILVKHEFSPVELDISEIKEIKEDYLHKMTGKFFVAKYYNKMRFLFVFTNALLTKAAIVTFLHLMNINYTTPILFNLYTIIGYFLFLTTLYSAFSGVIAIKSHKYLKLSHYNIYFILNILLTVSMLLIGNVQYVIGVDLYIYLHSDNRFLIYYVALLIIQIFAYALNMILSDFYKEYYFLYPLKKQFIKKKINVYR